MRKSKKKGVGLAHTMRRIATKYEACLRAHDRQPAKKPNDMPQAVLMKHCYGQLQKLANNAGRLTRLQSRVPSEHAPRGRLAELPSVWVLTLVHSYMGEITKSTRNTIRLHGYALDHALRAEVPVDFLIGFIHQEGGLRAIEQRYVGTRRTRSSE
jgi:hypothetical protein